LLFSRHTSFVPAANVTCYLADTLHLFLQLTSLVIKMKLEDLLGKPIILLATGTGDLPTNGDVLRHLWYLQEKATTRNNGLYKLEELFKDVAHDIVEHYRSQSLTTIEHRSIVRYSQSSDSPISRAKFFLSLYFHRF
jgi:hypothetical protein